MPTAQHQTALEFDEILHSGNAGMLVERVGQVRNEHRSEARQFARELAEYISMKQVGVATVFVFEETFGVKDRLHWFIHLKSIDHYETLVQMGDSDEQYRATFAKNWIPQESGGGTWARMFLDGSLRETVLLPQTWGMYGTKAGDSVDSLVVPDGRPLVLPGAAAQTSQPPHKMLNSANAGIVIHRTAQVIYDFRSEARQFAREAAEAINDNLAGEATVLLYEDAFGPMDRIHWLIHMRSLGTYQRLLELHLRDESVRDIFFRDRIPDEKGGGTWARMFVQGSFIDTALTPQHWGMYATERPADGNGDR